MFMKREMLAACQGIEVNLVHVGAHIGEERQFYRNELRARSVLWVEANPKIIHTLQTNVHGFFGHTCIQALVSDVGGLATDFFVTNNRQSSSMLPLQDHAQIYPHIRVSETLKLETTTLDALLPEDNWTVLNIDVQGAEIKVLRGADRTLPRIRVIYAEVNFREMYKGAMLIGDFDTELKKLGFNRAYTYDTQEGWGDAIYLR